MPAVARNGRAVSGAFAIRSTIFAARCCWAIAPRMCALVGFLFGHDYLQLVFSITARPRWRDQLAKRKNLLIVNPAGLRLQWLRYGV